MTATAPDHGPARTPNSPGRRRCSVRAVLSATAALAVVATPLVAAPASAAPGPQSTAPGAPSIVPTASASDPVDIEIRAQDIAKAAKNQNGLTFKGFGVLSANSTSALLMDYKAQHPEKYWELVKTLFGGDHPLMNTVKIEMGNDRNTSTGPNAATMRSATEYPNVFREPGFQLAADAKRAAKGHVHVSLLRWNRPAWVKSHTDQYRWFKNTVLAVNREYGYMVDSINPDANETHNPDQGLYKDFSGWVKKDQAGYVGADESDPNAGFASVQEGKAFRAIRTIAGDTVGTPPTAFGDAMTNAADSSLRDAVDVVGFHYSSADDANGNMKKIAEQLDQEVWNSEGQSTFSNSADRPNNNADNELGGKGTGFGGTNSALEMGNWVTTGFAASRRTMTIFQPAIGSFYDGFQYSSKELVSARDPWSGWLYYDGGLSVLAHFTQFAKVGWENEDNTAGVWRAIPQASKSELGTGNPPSGARKGGASYTTLAAPDGSDVSTVMVNDSSVTKTYRISGDALGKDRTAEVWQTSAAEGGQAYDENYLRPVAETTPDRDGTYTVTVKPFSAATFTTLDHARKAPGAKGALKPRAGYGNQAPHTKEYTTAGRDGRAVLDTDASGTLNGRTNDQVIYADDFDYAKAKSIKELDPRTGRLKDSKVSYLQARGDAQAPVGTDGDDANRRGVTPRYTNDTNGAFESVAEDSSNRVLRQQVGPGQAGGAWNGGDPKTTIGDSRWANYTVSVDARFIQDGDHYATVGAREQGGTNNGQNVSAAELKVDPKGEFSLLRFGKKVAGGNLSDHAEVGFKAGAGAWNMLSVTVRGDVYTASVNGVQVAEYKDPSPQATGRIQLGSSFSNVEFDDLEVTRVPGYTPYYTQVVDGMHQTSWDDTSKPVLEFNDKWNHVNGQGMFEWQRTASKSTAKGASLTYTFRGTGLDVIGTNDGLATLDVSVDGVKVATDARTRAAGSERTAFTLRGLRNAKHTVTLTTSNEAAFNVDAVGVIEGSDTGRHVDRSALKAAVAKVAGLSSRDHTPESWAVFSDARSQARKASIAPSAYKLDAEGASALVQRLQDAEDQLVARD
jgi:hypothetical protein